MQIVVLFSLAREVFDLMMMMVVVVERASNLAAQCRFAKRGKAIGNSAKPSQTRRDSRETGREAEVGRSCLEVLKEAMGP